MIRVALLLTLAALAFIACMAGLLFSALRDIKSLDTVVIIQTSAMLGMYVTWKLVHQAACAAESRAAEPGDYQ